MSYRCQFDLPNAVLASGTMKLRVFADITGYADLTGTAFEVVAGVGPFAGRFWLNCTGGALTSEVVDTGIVVFNLSSVTYQADIIAIDSDDSIEISDPGLDGIVDSSSVKFLAIPTSQPIISVDDHSESVDIEIGLYEYDDFTFTVSDDYDFYGAGFWYTLFRTLNGAPVQIFIRMEEGGVDSFVSYGEANLSSADFDEIALSNIASPSSGAKVRQLTVSVASGLHSLKNYNSVDIIDAAITHEQLMTYNFNYTILPPAPPYITNYALSFYGVALVDLLAEIISICYNQTFDQNAVQVRNEDITMKDASGDPGYWTQLYMFGRSNTGVNFGYLETLDTENYWALKYPTAFEILKAITFPFGLIPKYYYGDVNGNYDNATPANNKHRIELVTRGNSQDFVAPVGNVIQSNNTPYSPMIINNVRVSVPSYQFNNNDGTNSVVETRQDCDLFYNTSVSPLNTSIAELYTDNPDNLPLNEEYDIDILSDFMTRYTGGYTYPDIIDKTVVIKSLFHYNSFFGTGLPITQGEWYNYFTAAWVPWISNDFGEKDEFIKAVANYMYYRFKGQAIYTRVYSNVKSNDGAISSQRNTTCLRRHQITDEFSTRSFYAIRVRKGYSSNTSEITWFEQ